MNLNFEILVCENIFYRLIIFKTNNPLILIKYLKIIYYGIFKPLIISITMNLLITKTNTEI